MHGQLVAVRIVGVQHELAFGRVQFVLHDIIVHRPIEVQAIAHVIALLVHDGTHAIGLDVFRQHRNVGEDLVADAAQHRKRAFIELRAGIRQDVPAAERRRHGRTGLEQIRCFGPGLPDGGVLAGSGVQAVGRTRLRNRPARTVGRRGKIQGQKILPDQAGIRQILALIIRRGGGIDVGSGQTGVRRREASRCRRRTDRLWRGGQRGHHEQGFDKQDFGKQDRGQSDPFHLVSPVGLSPALLSLSVLSLPAPNLLVPAPRIDQLEATN